MRGRVHAGKDVERLSCGFEVIQTIGTIERTAHEAHQSGDSIAVGCHPQSVDGKDRGFIIIALCSHTLFTVN